MCHARIFLRITFWIVLLGLRAGGQESPGLDRQVAPDQANVAEEEKADFEGLDDDTSALLDLDLGDLREVEVAQNPFSGASDEEPSRFEEDIASATSISGDEAVARNTTDAGNLLAESVDSLGVYVQQRNTIIGDPRIRGYRVGQYLARADGAHWYPTRLDLDSILSKIDSKIIDEILVIPGPYSSRFGPGFSFIDVLTRPAPRYEEGFGWNGSTGVSYNGNGHQVSGNQYLQFGNDDWGGSVYYSQLVGQDYRDGGGRTVPSDYQSSNLNLTLGFDLSSGTVVELNYLRQDQNDVDLPGQFTDIDSLATDGFSLQLNSTDSSIANRIAFDTWYNHTRADGTAGNAEKQELFARIFDQVAPGSQGLSLPRNGSSMSDVESIGFSMAATYGEEIQPQLTLGTDLRYQTTSLSEVQSRPAGGGGFQAATDDVIAGIPESDSTNPGLFAELLIPVTDWISFRTGARVDWVSVHAGEGSIVRRGGNTSNLDVLGPDRDNHYTLFSGYTAFDYQITAELMTNISFGVAERAPTLTELYAMRPFESILQQGLNRIQGYPFLRPEQVTQIDWGLYSQEADVRWSARLFHAWIDDYITSQGIAVDPTSTSSRITSVFVNTPEATLRGGEMFGELDLTQRMSCFGNIMYVQGTNHTLNHELFGTTTMPSPPGSRQGNFFGRAAFDQDLGSEPLPQIPPLESRLGVRFQDSASFRWGTELSARIVDDQNRIANRSLLETRTPGFTTFDYRGFWRPFDKLTLTFGVLNITDKLYREHLDNHAGNQLFQPGISAYLGTEIFY